MTRRLDHPPLTILVPTTQARSAFWPWFAWNIAKQRHVDWTQIEVVTTAWEDDLARAELALPCALRTVKELADVPIARKRDVLLKMVATPLVAWWDDDDWHSPRRLATMLASILKPEVRPWAMSTGWTYLDLWSGESFVLGTHKHKPIYSSYVGSTEIARSVAFPPQTHGSDTVWGKELIKKYPDGVLVGRGHPYYVCLRHDRNHGIARLKSWQFDQPPGALIDALGPDEWEETTSELLALRQRLK